jgi:hypothetical protein
MLRLIIVILVAALSTACSLHPFPKIVKIRSLSQPIVVSESQDRSGDIAGLERTSTDKEGKIRANVLIVHGMGWSQQATREDRFGFDFIKAVESAYGVSGTLEKVTRLCPQSDKNGIRDKTYLPGGLWITAADNLGAMQTDAPLTRLRIKHLACMDRIVLNLGSKGTVNVYRFFWDDTFYNAYAYPHIGYDDHIFFNLEATEGSHRGYENINSLRASVNKTFKSKVVTYGFSDASMYLGPAGQQVRSAIRGGICAVINESTGQTRLLDDAKPLHAGAPSTDGFVGEERTADSLCSVRNAAREAPLTVITKSLGSRAVFDVLTNDMTTDLAAKLALISHDNLEVFMFANQIPLLGIGRMTAYSGDTKRIQISKKPKFIAISEINDLLTYELVPYFEHLYFLHCSLGEPCSQKYYRERVANFRKDEGLRRAYVNELGYEVIDVRATFAANVIPFVPFAHPGAAHGTHIRVKPIRNLFLCGAQAGMLRTAGCQGQ